MKVIILSLKKNLPSPIKRFMRKVSDRTLDLIDVSSRRRDMIPPRHMNFVGNGDYRKIGLEFRDLFTQYGGLKPDHTVLDVGFGLGRMAAPLTSYLSSVGEYHGFDIVQEGVTWAKDNISFRYPNFHFIHSDVRNKYYNPHGIYEPSSYRFPYSDGGFDFVYLTSVFTHVFPSDMENYLSEISRVLKKGGTCFITFFLMNKEAEHYIQGGMSTQNFIHEIGGCFTTTVSNPEEAIAFPDEYVRDVFKKKNLSIVAPIHYGSWCGRSEFLSYQDIVIARKL